jgi:hypothetical protein
MGESDHKEVSVDIDRLRKYGGWLMSKWSEIDELGGHVKTIKISPDAVTGGPELKQRFNDQRDALGRIITNLSGMVYQTGLNVTHLADTYSSASDLQKDDALRLQDTIGGMNKYYSGANDVMPPADPTTPNPSA